MFAQQELTLLDRAFAELKHADIDVPGDARESLIEYANQLGRANQITQLVSRKDEPVLFSRHIVECLALASAFDLHDRKQALDIGSGAGLPGLVLAVLFPGTQFTLIESKRKRAFFLQDTAKHLDLGNVAVHAERAEALPGLVHSADAVVLARAVASLEQLWRWTKILSGQEAATLLAMKGGDLRDEIKQLRSRDRHVRIRKLYYEPALVPADRQRCLLAVDHKREQ